ncbi:hypothetical protein ACFVY0_04835, partial [Streptomyces sp. NPDC058286]
SRHDAAGIAIGRRALGHPIRRRTAPPPQHQSDAAGHRTVQVVVPGNAREPAHPSRNVHTMHAAERDRKGNAGDQRIQNRSGRAQCQAAGPRLTPAH